MALISRLDWLSIGFQQAGGLQRLNKVIKPDSDYLDLIDRVHNPTGDFLMGDRGVSIYDRYLKLEHPDLEDITMKYVFYNLSREKKQSTHAIAGADYEVVQFYGKGNWKINIYGAFYTNNPFQYPKEDMSLLNEYFNKDEPIGVANDILNTVYDIHNIIILSDSPAPHETYTNFFTFNIEAVSYKEYNIIQEAI